MEFLSEIGLFSLKALVIVLSCITVLMTLAILAAKNKISQERLEITQLNDKFQRFESLLGSSSLSKEELKKRAKALKQKLKKNKNPENVFVIDFEGDIKASHVKQLRDEITAILTVANKNDEVVINIESPGGMVHGYGLAGAQIARLKQAEIPVTACVDKVAASGGYMMACVADKIIASPFAIVGSIGVLAQVPNFNRLLKKHNVDYEEITAGEYKRTISILGEITDKGRKKFTEDIQHTHDLFKDWVKENRPQLNMEEVATGEHWYGKSALDKGLVDEIKTSDQYLFELADSKNVLQVKIKGKKSLQEKIMDGAGKAISKNLPEWLQQLQSYRWY
jgi:serine protease SohB